MKIEFDENNKRQIIDRIQDYFLTERDEEIGLIASESLLDFIVSDIGRQIYNQGIEDGKRLLMNKVEDLEAEFDTLYK